MPANKRGVAKGPRMIKEILRLRSQGLSERKIAKALGCSRNTVKKYLSQELDGQTETGSGYQAPWSDEVDWPQVQEAVNRGRTLQEIWEGQVFSGVDSPPYVSFWREYRRRFPKFPLDYHKHHPPGERCEIDYKGDAPGLGYTDRATGEFIQCKLFGSICCFSQLFFPYATCTERQPDFIEGIRASYEYFGGVPLTTAFDNAKAAVTRTHRYDPDVHKELDHFFEHYGTAPMPTRPRKPKDKNLIENALGVFWRWARVRVQERSFFSLGELNEYLVTLADQFNHRVQRKYGTSRRYRFEQGDKPKLLALPSKPYNFGEWRTAKLHPDCHVQVEKNFYSAPFTLRGQSLEVRLTSQFVEIYSGLELVAKHLRLIGRVAGQYSTKDNHLPPNQQAMKEATPQAILSQAAEVGPATEAVVGHLFDSGRHPLMYLRRCQGILRLQKRYSKPGLERACCQIESIGVALPRLRDIEDIIKSNLDPKSASVTPIRRGPNPFLRGQNSWSDNNDKEENRDGI